MNYNYDDLCYIRRHIIRELLDLHLGFDGMDIIENENGELIFRIHIIDKKAISLLPPDIEGVPYVIDYQPII